MEIKTDDMSEEASLEDDKETNVPITPSGPVANVHTTIESVGESSAWSDDAMAGAISTPDDS
jgi:hypothetical protein